MDALTAATIRDEIRALRESWAWTDLLLPYFEARCRDLIASATAPTPAEPSHDEARYRLAELHQFQAWMKSVESNATEIARRGNVDLADAGPGEAPEPPRPEPMA
jgi:hypothetical protein